MDALTVIQELLDAQLAASADQSAEAHARLLAAQEQARRFIQAEREIDAQAEDYARNAWARAMTNGAEMERRFAERGL